MNKADGTVLISLDVEDNVSSVINKINDRFKGLGKDAGDEMEKSMKSNAQRVEEQATKTAKSIDSSLGKPVKTKVTLDDRELKTAAKESEKAIKQVSGDHVSRIDVEGNSVSAFKKMKSYLSSLTGKHDVEVNGEGNANEYLAKLQDNVESTKSSSLGLKDVFAGTFLGGAVLQGIQAVGGKINDLSGDAINASDAMDKFKSTMKLGGFGEKEINAASKEVRKYADQTVYELDDVSNTTAQLAANGVKGYMGLTEAAGNLNAQAGGNADTFKSVAMVLTQTAGAGKLTTENWNQMADAIPGASGVLQKAMKANGAYTGNFRDAMAAGKISSDEFNEAISKLGSNDGAKKAAKSTSTFEGAFGNLEAGVVGGIQDMVDAFGKGKLTGAINGVNDVSGKVFKSLANDIKVVTPALEHMGKQAQPALDSVSKGVKNLVKAFAPLVRSVGGLVVAVGKQVWKDFVGIIGGIAESISKMFNKGSTGSKLLQTLADAVSRIAKNKTAIKIISDAIIAMMTYKMAKGGLSLAVSLLDKMVLSYAKLTGLPGLLKSIFSVKADGSILNSLSKIKQVPSTLKALTPTALKTGAKDLSGASKMTKVATGAAGVSVAADAGFDIYKAFKAKNPESKFKNAGKGIGTAIGGGIGLFFGGPMGAMLGATIGKVIGGWGGKATKSFTDGWNKKGRDAKPPKGIMQKAGYYARMGGDAIAGWAKGLTKWAKSNKKVIIATLINPFFGLATWFLTDTKLGKSISKWVKNAIKSIPKMISGAWKSITKTVSGWGKSIGKALKPVSKAFGAVWKGIKKAASVFVKGLKIVLLAPIVLLAAAIVAVWSKIKKPVTKAVKAISNVVKTVFKSLSKVVKTIFKTISKYIINPISDAYKNIKKWVGKIANSIKKAFVSIEKWIKKTWGKISYIISRAVKDAWKGVKKWFGKVEDVVHDIFNPLFKWVRKLWDKISSVISDAVKNTWKTVKKWFGKIKDIIHDILNPLFKWIRKIWNNIYNTITDIAGNIWKNVKKTFGKMKDGLDSIGKAISKTWKSTWKGVASFFGDIWKGIKKTAQDGINGVIGFLNGGIRGIDKVIKAFGGKKDAISTIPTVHFATGTGAFGNSPRRAITKPTPAIVNDGMEADNRELIFRNSGAVEMFNHKNAQTVLMPGDEVASARESAIMAPMLGIEHFATGTGAFGNLLSSLLGDDKKDKQSRGFFSDVTNSIGKAVGGAVSTVGGWVKSGLNGLKNLYNTAKKIIKNPMKAFTSSFKFSGKKIPGVIQNIATGGAKMVVKEAKNWWSNLWSMADLDGSAAGGNWSHSPGPGWTHSDVFGSGRGNGTHDGNDFSASQGTPIHAVHGGKVVRIGGAPSGWGPVGYNIVTKGNDGQYVIYQEFGHASDAFVSKGDTVKTGQKIAKLGNSGLGTGPHVHIGVSKNYPFNNRGTTTSGWKDLMDMHGGSSGVSKKDKGKSDKGLQKKIKGQVGGKFFKFIQKLADKFAPKDESGGGSASGGTVSTSLIKKAAKIAGVHGLTNADIAHIKNVVQHESGGNAKSINKWDSNAKAGHPSKGILQFIDSTFQHYAKPGYGNIYSALDQLIAMFRDSSWRSDLTLGGWGPTGSVRHANGGWAIPGLLNIFGEVPGEPELAINPKRASADGHIAEAIQARAKEAPNSFSGKMAMVASKAKQGLPTISGVPTIATSNNSTETERESKLGQLINKLSNKNNDIVVQGDVFMDGQKLGKLIDQRNNTKLNQDMFWSGQLGKLRS